MLHENDRKRQLKQKGRAELKMNGCGTNAHLINLFSSVSHSQYASLQTPNYPICYLLYITYSGVSFPLTCVCVCAVCFCACCHTHAALSDRPTECFRADMNSLHAAQRCKPKGNGKERGEAETRVIKTNRQCSLKISSTAATAPYWQNASEGKRT